MLLRKENKQLIIYNVQIDVPSSKTILLKIKLFLTSIPISPALLKIISKQNGNAKNVL